jgi:hypothetical protein
VSIIEVPNVSTANRLHEPADPFRVGGRHQQVYVIGHEHVGMDRALKAPCRGEQRRPEDEIIGRRGKQRCLVIAPLDDVLSTSGCPEARLASHATSWREWRSNAQSFLGSAGYFNAPGSLESDPDPADRTLTPNYVGQHIHST